MLEMSLEAERATRVRAKQKANDALTQSQVAIDLKKQLMIQMVELKKKNLWSTTIVLVTDHVVPPNLLHILIMKITWRTNHCIVTLDLGCFRLVFSTRTTFFGRAYFVGNLL